MSGTYHDDTATALSELSRLPPVTSRLLNMPQELKDLIFHELWELGPDIRLRQKTPDHTLAGIDVLITLSYGSPQTDQPYSIGLPIWLMTSRAILADGLRQLYRHAIWKWDDDRFPYVLSVGNNNPLAGLSVATNLR